MTSIKEDDINPYEDVLAGEDDLEADLFPHFYTLSGAFLYQFIPRPKASKMPEFLYVKVDPSFNPHDMLTLHEWNFAWEAGHLRHDMFSDKLPKKLDWLKRFENHNIYLLPLVSKNRYFAYSALFHLLPWKTRQKFGLPFIKQGLWPLNFPTKHFDLVLPNDFDIRLQNAFAYHIWPLLDKGSRLSAFSNSDPIKLLAHNLDYWLPHAFKVIENRMQEFPRVEIESAKQRSLLGKLHKNMPDDIRASRPLMGGTLWMGEDESWDVTKEIVNSADSSGQLRSLIEAVKSNRVEEDFSSRWSYAREDFERKLYKKRTKVKVSFVELKDTIPVHGPDSEVHENILWEDFIGLVNKKDQRVIVCLRNGLTRVGDISKELGYINHSPVSKALARIRKQAADFLSN
jgi:hypothetical protein